MGGAPAPKGKEAYPSFTWKHEVAHKAPYVNSDKAYFLGIKPGTPMEFWEYPTYFVLGFAFILTIYGIANPRQTTSDWARREALARNEAMANGEDIQFGKFMIAPPSLYKDE